MLQHPFHSSFPFTLEPWHLLASPADPELQSSPWGNGCSPLLCLHPAPPQRQLCSALLSVFLSKEEELEEQPVQYQGWGLSGCVPRARSAQPSSEHLFLAGSLRAQSSSHTQLELLPAPQCCKGKHYQFIFTEIKAKPGISSPLRISDNIFNAF